jgi:hypothetical protein
MAYDTRGFVSGLLRGAEEVVSSPRPFCGDSTAGERHLSGCAHAALPLLSFLLFASAATSRQSAECEDLAW